MDLKIVKVETNFEVSIQAQNILSQTKYTVKELVEWKRKQNQTIGGHDVMFFLEDMSRGDT